MKKKLKFVRYVVANLAIAAVVVGMLVFTLSGNVVSVSGGKSPVYKGENDKKVSLMVNVYWGTEFLDDMLRILADRGVTTTFFVGGSWAAQNEGMLKKIADAGHEIGNHGYFHKDHKKLSATHNYEEINVTHQLVKSILDVNMTLFAPPSGSFSKITLDQAEALGYTTVMWSKDTIDWRDHNTEQIFSRATKKIEGGDLILMHPTKNTVEALDRILAVIAEKGLTAAKVSEVLSA